ncbi:nucleotide-binding protein [Clostridium sp. Cult2]|uniref:nucleotide-binding protein n=1 Tax=Clostridium sp. Cult2 TaxID=2079003 RepID=UPI001F15CF93|nr:AAA family ATPase [Clostridium sp. Cult2]
MEKIKVLIVEVQEEERRLVSDTLSKVDYITLVGETEDLEETNYTIEEYSPNVILLGDNLEFDKYSFARSLSKEYPEIAIIIIEDELREDTVYKAMFAGAKDVVITPINSAKLIDSIYRSYELVKDKRIVHRDRPISTKRKSRRGHVITVFSTKGGVGKTFISTNLAASLAKNTEKRVCLVDLDLDFGNVALALNIIPRYTILDIVDDIRNIDQDLIESYLIPHESGIKVLPANAKPQINEFVNAEHIEIILRALQGTFDYIVVDMPARFYEPINPAFQFADILLMITTPEISTLRNVKASILTLHEFNFPKSKIKVVLNRADNKGQIRPKDVESTLSENLFGIIDADYKLAILSLNNGNPIVLDKPRSSISKSIVNLVKNINSEFQIEQK